MKRGTGSGNRRNRRIGRRVNRNSSGGRNRNSRAARRQGRRVRGVGDSNILELEERRVISRQRRGEPLVVVHLDAERGF